MRFIIPPIYAKLLLLFCIYTSTHTFYAQEQEIDSLAKYSDSELYRLSLESLYDKSNKSFTYANKLFENAKNKNDNTQLFQAYKLYGILENEKGNHEKAFQHIDTARDIAVKSLKNKKLEALATFMKGKFFYDYGKYEEAFEHYKTAYNYYKDSNERMSYIISYNTALIKNVLGDQKGALKILLKNYNDYKASSEDERKTNFTPHSYSNILITLGDTYLKYANDEKDLRNRFLDSARIYNRLGLKETEFTKENNTYIYFLTQKGIISYEEEKYKQAILEFSVAESKAIAQNDIGNLSSIYYYTGVSHKNLNEEDEAIKFLKKTDSLAKKNAKNYLLLDRTYYTLTDIFSKRGDGENTSKYWELYKKNNKINEHVSKNVKNAIKDYDIEKLEEQIKNLIAAKKKEEKNYSKALIIIFILGLILITYLIYSSKKQRYNKAKFTKLLKELETNKKEESPIQQKKAKSTLTIDEEKVQQILIALTKFEQKEQFLDANCDLAFVAKKVKTNKAYLSKVIHSEKQQKFIKYITDLRINYALEKLKEDKLFRSYDIKSIASELGFKSPDSFSRAFKNKTGIYPSYYIKNINKINSSEDI
ncbi:MAG: helix-turn-helix domain-containing protein [Kordia sp.]|uniref:helix-turn-helix domain-containing protein n=1 Tax=Kordia sp. TaxID=1965332 RepID=UPI00385D0B9C